MTYMLDTNICIYVMKKKPEAALRRFRQEMDGGLCISSVTLAELEFGVQNSSDPIRNGQALLRFLAPLSVLPFGPAAASEYGAVRAFLQKKGTPIGPLDMLIAAHADRPAGYADRGPRPRRGPDPGDQQHRRVCPRAGVGAGKLGGINQEPRCKAGLFAARNKKALSVWTRLFLRCVCAGRCSRRLQNRSLWVPVRISFRISVSRAT